MGLRETLGAAYHQNAAGDRQGAVAQIRAAIGDRGIAEKHLADLADLVRARTRGARCHVHIEKASHDLLAEALENA